jgi:hypothetical protein
LGRSNTLDVSHRALRHRYHDHRFGSIEMKARIIIRMGASKFTAAVRNGDQITLFDLRSMTNKNQHIFRRELVKAWRIGQETQPA